MFSKYMFSNVFDRVYPTMKIAFSFMPLMWASIVFLLPLCFLGQQTLMGNLSFLPFPLFSLTVKVSSSFLMFSCCSCFY